VQFNNSNVCQRIFIFYFFYLSELLSNLLKYWYARLFLLIVVYFELFTSSRTIEDIIWAGSVPIDGNVPKVVVSYGKKF
jgi:hypothetical protein